MLQNVPGRRLIEGVCVMTVARNDGWRFLLGAALVVTGVVGIVVPGSLTAQSSDAVGDVTYTKDIAPILQRSCENCHRVDGVAPMSLSNYEEVRPWARAIKQRTGIGPHAGVMPPWYMEKNIGLQKYKDDPSLSEDEVRKVALWVDSGAPWKPGRHAAGEAVCGREHLA